MASIGAPHPPSPILPSPPQQYLTDHEEYKRTAKYWTEMYANPTSKAPEEKVQRIVEMGFDRASAVAALQASGGDEAAAVEKLLGG